MTEMNFNTAPLNDLVTIRSGGTPSKQNSDYWGGDIPWVSAKDMKGAFLTDAEDHVTLLGAQSGTKIANPGDILILVRGMTLHHDVPICLAMRRVAFNQDVKALTPHGVDGRFLFYALKASKHELLRRVDAAGHGTGRLNTELLKSLRIPRFAPNTEQDIAKLLKALDEKIILNSEHSQTLENAIAAIFRSWFVDYDPVKAKSDGRAPAFVDDLTASLFPDSFAESGIPTGWRLVTADECVTVTKGRSYKSKELADSDKALVTLKCFGRGGSYRPDGIKPYTGPYKSEQVVEPGEIIMSMTDVTQAADVIGRATVARHSEPYSLLVASLDVAILRPKEGWRDSPEYLHQTFRSPEFVEHAKSHVTGTTVLHLSHDAVRSFNILMPTQELLQAFQNKVQPMRDRILQLEIESNTLADIRDTLLPQLMSGDVRVDEGIERIEEVA
jgi:type I restriction enzyme S subunit